MKRKILVGLTTISGDEWKNKIKEIDKLGIKELALFPTCLNAKQRKELYKKLEKTGLKRIPHVHIRHDFESWELDYLVERFKTKAFNLHPYLESMEIINKNKKHSHKIFVENLIDFKFFRQVAEMCGGICLDVSHWEDYGKKQKMKCYNNFLGYLKTKKIGCNHISGIREKKYLHFSKKMDKEISSYSYHSLKNLEELDYVKKYKKYLSDIISIELENPFREQLEVKKYLEKIIN